MSTPAIHSVRVKCRFCSQWRHPEEFDVPIVGHCFSCLERHAKELAVLEASDPPVECPGCQTPTDLLPRDANGDLRMRLHPMDGVYALLCEACTEKYEQKRVDLYGDTPYGHMKRLKTRT